jgi:hypothetical protein
MVTPFGYPGLTPAVNSPVERRCLVSAKIQVLLVVLATIVFAALNAATPWGP